MVNVTDVHMEGGSGHEHIAEVKWRNPSNGETGISSRQQMIEFINGGGDVRVQVGSNSVQVGVWEKKWLRTHADGVWKDNLLALPRY